MVFSAGAAVCVFMAGWMWLEIRRTHRALPRMQVTTGVVGELESVLFDRNRDHVRSQTLVRVAFTVDGTEYCCRTLYLFRGNQHVGDVGKRFDFQPGQRVGVHYDPADPRRSALIVDTPRYDTVGWILGAAVVLAGIAVFEAM